jgi:DNA primase
VRSAYDQHDPIVNVERQALKLAIQRPALCGPAFDELPSAVFTVPAHAAVCELIAASGGVVSARSGREWAERLRTAAPNDNARGFVTRLAVEPLEVPGPTAEPDAKFAEAVLARVEELSVSRDIASIKSRLQRLSPVAEQADYNRMFGDLVAFEQRRKVLSERASGAL